MFFWTRRQKQARQASLSHPHRAPGTEARARPTASSRSQLPEHSVECAAAHTKLPEQALVWADAGCGYRTRSGKVPPASTGRCGRMIKLLGSAGSPTVVRKGGGGKGGAGKEEQDQEGGCGRASHVCVCDGQGMVGEGGGEKRTDAAEITAEAADNRDERALAAPVNAQIIIIRNLNIEEKSLVNGARRRGSGAGARRLGRQGGWGVGARRLGCSCRTRLGR